MIPGQVNRGGLMAHLYLIPTNGQVELLLLQPEAKQPRIPQNRGGTDARADAGLAASVPQGD